MKNGKHIATCGVFSAGSLAFLYFASVLPSGRVGFCAAAGLFPLGAIILCGKNAGILCWIVSSMLAFFFIPDKTIVFLYFIFLGIYPIVKAAIEAKKSIPLEIFLKILYYMVSFLFLRFFSKIFFPAAYVQWHSIKQWLLFLFGCLVFLVYDLGLTQFILMLKKRTPRK